MEEFYAGKLGRVSILTVSRVPESNLNTQIVDLRYISTSSARAQFQILYKKNNSIVKVATALRLVLRNSA